MVQHRANALPVDEFRAAIAPGSPIQFALLRDLHLAVAGKTVEGETVFGWASNQQDHETLLRTVLSSTHKARDVKARFYAVFQVEGEAVRKVELADSLFGPMLPPEPTRTYRIVLPLWFRVGTWVSVVVAILLAVACLGAEVVIVALSLDVPLNPKLIFIGIMAIVLAWYFARYLRANGKTVELCDYEIPADFGRKVSIWNTPPESRIRNHPSAPPNWLVRVDPAPATGEPS